MGKVSQFELLRLIQSSVTYILPSSAPIDNNSSQTVNVKCLIIKSYWKIKQNFFKIKKYDTEIERLKLLVFYQDLYQFLIKLS
jgi:hypothetical protein